MIEISRADPRDFVTFLEASDAYAASLYPAESNHMLDVETLCQPQMNFFGAFVDGTAKGCGGFWTHQDYVEIKRVFIDPSARGLGLSKALMQVIENAARDLGFRIARLETGIHQPEALGLYEKLGYKYREPFGDYLLDPLSVFMEKAL
ncbi:MAG: GNAT family N-acetyltransferase [Aestuariivirga sp.]